MTSRECVTTARGVESAPATERKTFWEMNAYQWTVLFAAWLGWGFDCFDGLLFNYVAPNCVPTLLHIPLGSALAQQKTAFWTGILTSVLLLGWAVGGVVFGRVADRIGRSRTLLLTMLLYALGTALCAIAPNLWVLLCFRIIASLGIGGEWAAGAAMVAEVVPERRRVEAGALLYTSAPMGLFLATFITFEISGRILPGSPETSWRYVFLSGLIPAAIAFVVRMFIREPDRWHQVAAQAHPKIRDLFRPEYRALTLSGVLMALTALLMWWSCNAFIPVVSTNLARRAAGQLGLDRAGTLAMVESFKATATNVFNLGGVIGTLLTVPASKILGRKKMFAIYFALAAPSLFCAFELPLEPRARLYMYFPIGLTVFGVFGSFTYYLPELFPTRLRGTGAGFCYNIGRVLTAAGPIVIGELSRRSADPLDASLHALFWVGVVPVLGLLAMPFVIETKGRALAD